MLHRQTLSRLPLNPVRTAMCSPSASAFLADVGWRGGPNRRQEDAPLAMLTSRPSSADSKPHSRFYRNIHGLDGGVAGLLEWTGHGLGMAFRVNRPAAQGVFSGRQAGQERGPMDFRQPHRPRV